ncbi:hypothetical protein OEZ86_007089 [Tetradesmus obliquus]|nr:hypothetical protein OEZ86_007089 [Tetradesmus obliquus]
MRLNVTNGCQGVMLTMPFTIAVYMVRGFLQQQQRYEGAFLQGQQLQQGGGGHGAAVAAGVDEQLVGQLTGALAAVYSLSQFTTSYAWGLASNRIGRKPIMLLGSAASAAGLLWFGAAGSYASAAASRAAAGLLNGIIVAWKCMIGESCDPLTQGRAMSYMSLAWGLGCIAGPTIGGLLAQPCASWPGMAGCSTDGLLRVRPYLLPSHGGLSLPEVQLAGPLAFGGLCLMSFSLLAYPRLQQAFGMLPVARAGLLLAAVVSIAIPLAGCSAFTSSMILVNALPPPQQLGQVNGVGQSLASLARGLGPGLGGVLWGAAVGFNSPGAALLPYGLVAGVALGGWGIYWFVAMPEGVEVSAGRSKTGNREEQQQAGIVGSSCCQK